MEELKMISKQHPILNLTVREIGDLSVEKFEICRNELINWMCEYRIHTNKNKMVRSLEDTHNIFRYFLEKSKGA